MLRALRIALVLTLIVSAPAAAAALGLWSAGGRLDGGLASSLLVAPEPAPALLAAIGVLGLWAFGRAPE